MMGFWPPQSSSSKMLTADPLVCRSSAKWLSSFSPPSGDGMPRVAAKDAKKNPVPNRTEPYALFQGNFGGVSNMGEVT